jgi:hypothetical protein
MSRPGPAVRTLKKWVTNTIRDGAQRFRCFTDDGERIVKVAMRGSRGPNVVVALRAVEAVRPTRVEALLEEDNILDVFEVPSDELPVAAASSGDVYARDEGDTKEERLLKTVAVLLAEAHRVAAKQLVEVVQIQSAAAAEQGRHYAAALQASERLLRRAGPTRVRIADGGDDGGPVEAEEPKDDFMSSMLQTVLQGMVRREVAGVVDDDKPAAGNGAKGNA